MICLKLAYPAQSTPPYLSQSAAAKLDYCSSVFTGLPAGQVARLQRVQNSAKRLVMERRRRDHVTLPLNELHWLPVKFRCQLLSTRLRLLLTAIMKGLYLLIFLHFSALMNRLAHSDLLIKSCSKVKGCCTIVVTRQRHCCTTVVKGQRHWCTTV